MKTDAVYDFLTHAEVSLTQRDITMLERISFQLANNRGRYTHFVHHDGSIASLYPMETLFEARVGIMSEGDFPTETQYDVIDELASLAVGLNAQVMMTFEEGTSPFPARFPKDHPANTLLDIQLKRE